MSEQDTEVTIVDESELPSNIPPKPDKQEEIESELTNIKNEVRQQGMAAQLLADPDIQAVLLRKQRGEKIKVVSEKEEKKDEPMPSNFAELSADQQTEFIVKKAASVVESKLDTKLNELTSLVQGLQGVLQNGENEKAETRVRETQKKFPDFDAYKREMIDINKKNPGLDPEQLYILAKHKKGVLLKDADEPNPSSERTSESSVQRNGDRKKEPMKSGARGFNDAIERVLSNIKFPDNFMEE